MKTTINNNERVFQIITSTGEQFFCNLKDIDNVINENELIDRYYTINHFWNNKPKKVSKKYLKEMQEANRI